MRFAHLFQPTECSCNIICCCCRCRSSPPTQWNSMFKLREILLRLSHKICAPEFNRMELLSMCINIYRLIHEKSISLLHTQTVRICISKWNVESFSSFNRKSAKFVGAAWKHLDFHEIHNDFYSFFFFCSRFFFRHIPKDPVNWNVYRWAYMCAWPEECQNFKQALQMRARERWSVSGRPFSIEFSANEVNFVQCVSFVWAKFVLHYWMPSIFYTSPSFQTIYIYTNNMHEVYMCIILARACWCRFK